MLMSTTPSNSILEHRPSVVSQGTERAMTRVRKKLRVHKMAAILIGIAAILILFVIVIVLVMMRKRMTSKLTKNYCASNLCPRGARHIACNPDPGTCTDYSVLELSADDRENILDMHNTCRSEVALGALPASNMRKLIWDDELAYLARVHGARCHPYHDECRNTERFKDVGQNIDLLDEFVDCSEMQHTCVRQSSDCYSQAILSWCEQGHIATRGVTEKYSNSKYPAMREFAQLAKDSARRVGCAVVYYRGPDSDKKVCLTICNYDVATVEGQQIYNIGK